MRAITLVVVAGCGRFGFAPTEKDAADDAFVPPDIVAQPGCGAVSVAVGEIHTCVLVENGATYCTGENMFGQLGTGAVSADVATPVLATKIVGAASLYGGRGFTSYIDTSANVQCLGVNANRQCGVTGVPMPFDPVKPAGVPTVLRLSTGYSAGCATTTTNDVYCWGDGDEGQPGNGTSPGSHAPELVPALTGTSATVSVGATHICSLVSGAVSCWGDARDLRLGVPGPDTCPNASAGAIECALTPIGVAVPAMKIIRPGEEHTCALTEPDGHVWCWGSNDQGQVGVTKSALESPMRIGTLDSIVDIVAAHDHSCVLDAAGAVKCWGDNVSLQLGATGSDSVIPIVVPLPEPATSLYAGPSAYHTCAILESGTVWCWGRGTNGQLGRSTIVDGLPAPMLLPCP